MKSRKKIYGSATHRGKTNSKDAFFDKIDKNVIFESWKICGRLLMQKTAHFETRF